MAGSDAHVTPWRAFNSAFMAGGERYVQSVSLKTFSLSRGRFSTPGFGAARRDGALDSLSNPPPAVRSRFEPRVTTMTTHENLPPGAVDAAGGVFFLTVDRKDRSSIATTIENLINMLDDMDTDCDLEPSLGGYFGASDDREDACEDEGAQCEDEGVCDDFEPSHGWTVDGVVGKADDDERELENEHGGNITDEPHDAVDEGDAEPNLGRLETVHQGLGTYMGSEHGHERVNFNGDGYLAGRKVLRNLWCKRPDRKQNWQSLAVGIGNPDALKVDGLTITGKAAGPC